MKKSMLGLLLIGLMSSNAFAGCEDAYKSNIARLEKNYKDDPIRRREVLSGALKIAISAPISVASTAATIVLSTNSGPLFISTSAGAVTAAGAVVDGYTTIKEAIHPIEALSNLNASLTIINESNLGDGKLVRILTEKINEKCSNEYNQPLEVAQIAEIISNLNEENVLCQKENELAAYSTIQSLVLRKINRGCAF